MRFPPNGDLLTCTYAAALKCFLSDYEQKSRYIVQLRIQFVENKVFLLGFAHGSGYNDYGLGVCSLLSPFFVSALSEYVK